MHFVKNNFADIRQKDIITLDGLKKGQLQPGQLIQLDDVTRIKMALRNQDQLARLPAILLERLETLQSTLQKLFQQKKNSVKL